MVKISPLRQELLSLRAERRKIFIKLRKASKPAPVKKKKVKVVKQKESKILKALVDFIRPKKNKVRRRRKKK